MGAGLGSAMALFRGFVLSVSWVRATGLGSSVRGYRGFVRSWVRPFMAPAKSKIVDAGDGLWWWIGARAGGSFSLRFFLPLSLSLRALFRISENCDLK